MPSITITINLMFKSLSGTSSPVSAIRKGVANPTALMLVAAMLLDHVDLSEKGNRIRAAIKRCLAKPAIRTGDLKGQLNTQDFATAVIEALD